VIYCHNDHKCDSAEIQEAETQTTYHKHRPWVCVRNTDTHTGGLHHCRCVRVRERERVCVCVWLGQVTFIYTALFTAQSVSKQLYRDNMKIMQQSLFPEENSVTVQL